MLCFLFLLSAILRSKDVFPISQMGKPRLRKAKCFFQDDRESQWLVSTLKLRARGGRGMVRRRATLRGRERRGVPRPCPGT